MVQNPYNGIESLRYVPSNPNRTTRIHTMELKAFHEPTRVSETVMWNPYNGIESVNSRLQELIGDGATIESIQWN